MKKLLYILACGVLPALASFILPWYSIAIIPFIISYVLNMPPRVAFWGAFTGVAIYWLIAALMKDIPNNHVLSGMVAKVLFVQDYRALLAVTALIGGLVGGLGALSGAYMYEVKLRRK